MSELLDTLKSYYETAMKGNFEWRGLYPNNMIQNGKEGVYTCFWFKKGDKYELVKYTVKYEYKIDEKWCCYPDEGVKYYLLYEYRNEFDRKYLLQEPTTESSIFLEKAPDGYLDQCFCNNYGRFCHVYDDEHTAKSAAKYGLLHIIYPMTYVLSDDECEEWNKFVDSVKSKYS